MSKMTNPACLRCKKHKRKCDKVLPACSLCKRLHQACNYPLGEASPGVCQTSIDKILREQVAAVVGHGLRLREAAATYFATVNSWLPVVSETHYYGRLLSAVPAAPELPADFNLLTLAMFLVCVMPVDGEGVPAQARSLYALIKGSVATLEAAANKSLEMLQSRLLLTVFEVGHALYPAAYISSGSNVRAAIALGANSGSLDRMEGVFKTRHRAEEARRTWQGILVTDRFASLESGTSPGPPLRLSLDEAKDNEIIVDNVACAELGPFLKLLQASHLADQVLVHIYEKTSHHDFNAAEAAQIIKTLASFLGTFDDEGPSNHVISSSAMAVCRSAMIEILVVGYQIDNPGNDYCTITSLNMLKYAVSEIAHGATHVISSTSLPRIETLPVFISHCVYKAAMVYHQILRKYENLDVEMPLQQLKSLLQYVGMRWDAANQYIDAIEKIR